MAPTKSLTTFLSYKTIQKYYYGALILDIFSKNLIAYVKIQEKRGKVYFKARKRKS